MNKKLQEMAQAVIKGYQHTKKRMTDAHLKDVAEGIPIELAQLELISSINRNFLKTVEVFMVLSESLPDGLMTKMTPQDIVDMYTHFITHINIIVLKEQEVPHDKETKTDPNNTGHLN